MNMEKGSWKNISLTSGKGLDLRFGPMGLCTNVATARGDCGDTCRPSGRSLDRVEDKYLRSLYLAQRKTIPELEQTRGILLFNQNNEL